MEPNMENQLKPVKDEYFELALGFSLQTSDVNVVGAIIGKGLGFTLTAIDGLPLG